MPDKDDTPAVACTLTEDQLAERPEEIRAVLVENHDRAEEQPDGYTHVFAGTDETFTAVSTFVANEHECCSFAEYTISVSPPYNESRLTITGPEGTKDLFGEQFIENLDNETLPAEVD